MNNGRFTPWMRLAIIAGLVVAFLLLEVVPTVIVLEALGIGAVVDLLVVDFPHTWRMLRRQPPNRWR